jgi:hypothetical protein
VVVFGVVLNAVFQTALNRHLDRLPPAIADVESRRSKLAAIRTNDAVTRRAVGESFVEVLLPGLWMAAKLAALSSVSAAALPASGLDRSSTWRTAPKPRPARNRR